MIQLTALEILQDNITSETQYRTYMISVNPEFIESYSEHYDQNDLPLFTDLTMASGLTTVIKMNYEAFDNFINSCNQINKIIEKQKKEN